MISPASAAVGGFCLFLAKLCMAAAEDANAPVYNDGLAMIPWLRANGGFFSEKLEFRHLDPDDETSPNGLFALAPLEQDETLMIIPHKCLLTDPEDPTFCGVTQALMNQVELGEDAFFKNYVDYLFDGTKRGKLPDRWSREARAIVQKMLGPELASQMSNLFQDRTHTRKCEGSGSDLEEDAFDFVIARSWNEVMIPVYDMVNHKNGDWRNVEATSAHTGEDVRVYAYQEIAAGEQLFISYNECLDTDCEGLSEIYGTQEILYDYGFVETYPQRWIFQGMPSLEDEDVKIIFDIDRVQRKFSKTGEEKDIFEVTFRSEDRPDLMMVSVMTSQVERLRNLEGWVRDQVNELDSEHERYTVLEYYSALTTALQQVVWAFYDEDKFETSTDTAERENGTCASSDCSKSPKYDRLEDRPIVGNPNGDYLSVCHYSHEGMANGYRTIYEYDSQYQNIEFRHSFKKDDTCLFLAGWGQTCTSFRQYHEALVHYPASFVEKVKRVVYIGGGDNMILHEILKYPDLELVVGLELDQAVVRYSFMNLGTLPYFDDPRVQWWFGDATKSLLMLPEDYFGSFDLVLVDLQTFVADALRVTPDLSVMDTMKLLMQPNGVISKNEDFPNRQVTDFAKYTVDFEYCDLPQLCRQSITIGSNQVDFLHAKQYEHNVDRIYLTKSLSPEGRFNNWYGFRKNEFKNNSASEPKVETSSGAQTSHGVFVVIEAEELNGSVDTQDGYISAIRKTLEAHGITILSVVASQSKPQASWFDAVLFLREGYVAIRKHSDAAYLAIDLVLWDAIDDLNAIKKALVESIGGSDQTTSSFRMAAGGINGVGGPTHIMNLKPEAVEPSCEAGENDSLTSEGQTIMWQQMINMIPKEAPHILVVCGTEDQLCSSHEALRAIGTDFVKLHSCAELQDDADDPDLFECETIVSEKLHEKPIGKIDGIWLDSGISKGMAQVLLRLFSSQEGKGLLLNKDFVLMAELTEHTWMNTLLERFLTEVSPFSPSKDARIVLGNSAEFGLFSSGDDQFYSRLADLLEEAEAKIGMRPEVRETKSGHATYTPDFSPKFFTNFDYNNTRAYGQWQSQRAVAFQTLFQFELEAPKTVLEAGEKVLYQYDDNVWTGLWRKVRVVRQNDDLTYMLRDEHKGTYNGISRNSIRRLDFDSNAVPPPTIDIGTRVLIKGRGYWRQGFVSSRADDGRTYEIRNFDGDGGVNTVDVQYLMPQFEATNAEELPTLSVKRLKKVFQKGLDRALQVPHSTIQYDGIEIGSGCMLAAFWEKGNAVLTWNGDGRIDVNFYLEVEEEELGDRFLQEIRGKIPFLELRSRDEQPRGYGRVVNFMSEIDSEKIPIWWSE